MKPMKRWLSLLFALLMLLGTGTVAASAAMTQEDAQALEESVNEALAEYYEAFYARILKLSSEGSAALNYEINAKTKEAEEAYKALYQAQEPWNPNYDYEPLMNAWKTWMAVKLETEQAALAIRVPAKVWKLLGENAVLKSLNFLWAWILRYLFFGFAWMPY